MNLNVIKGNVLGGITAGVIALPLALAFGVASGLGAAAGLYGAIILGFFASLFGGTPTQVSGPTGPMTVVIAAMVALYPQEHSIVFAAIILAGVFQIVFGLTRVGQLVKAVPYPVISGFMNGIAAIIIILQLNNLCGFHYTGSTIGSLINVIHNIGDVHLPSLFLGFLTLFIVFFTPKKLSEKIPESLIALVLVTLVSILFNFNVPTIGAIPQSFPNFVFPMFDPANLKTVLSFALTLAVLGSIDSLLTSLVADSITHTKHNPQKELIGQGIGNAMAGIFGGMAGAGATMRTVVNIKSGGTSKLSGMIHSLFLLAVVLCLAPVAAKIPLAVLAGILVKVGVGIIDYKFLKVIKYVPKYDLFVMFLVFFLTVFSDLILAVGVGIVASAILFIVDVSHHTRVDISNSDDTKNKFTKIHIDGAFFFGSASQIAERLENNLVGNAVIFDCKDIKILDVTAVFALETLLSTLNDNGVKTILVINNKNLAAKIFNLGLNKVIAQEDIVFNDEEAYKKLQN